MQTYDFLYRVAFLCIFLLSIQLSRKDLLQINNISFYPSTLCLNKKGATFIFAITLANLGRFL